MICARCPQRDVCDLAGKYDPLLTGCDASHGTWAFDRLRLDRMTADRAALRAELDLVHGAIRADDERLYAAWVRIHGAPDDCANIACDAPEWMADEILRLRAELERTKEELERVRRNHLRRMIYAIDCRLVSLHRFAWQINKSRRVARLLDAARAALERKYGA